jgi:small subunit ribosomal protein S17
MTEGQDVAEETTEDQTAGPPPRGSGEARPSKTIEERIAERTERRRQNAASRRRWRAARREKRRAAGPGEGTPPAERTGTGSPRIRQGVVISDKGDKTISVRIDMARQHRTYGKIVRSTSTLHAHDERNEAKAGDTVRVIESRPLSRTKRWRLVEVVERGR